MASFSIGDVLRRALGRTFGHPLALAGVSTLPIACVVAVWWLWERTLTTDEAAEDFGLPLALLLVAAVTLAIAQIAVAWHRYVLRGEITLWPAGLPLLRFFVRNVWLFFIGIPVQIVGFLALALIVVALGGAEATLEQMWGRGLFRGDFWGTPVAAAAFATVPFAFYGLILPAAAIGDRGLLAVESRRLLRGRRLAVLALLTGIAVAFALASAALDAAFEAMMANEDDLSLPWVIASTVLGVLEIAVFAGVLSELYRALRLPELAPAGGKPE
ncbi:hypothetical protein KXS07_13985 [Inquilinus limosus]|uniref:hypothetical protein n=1 Tax=Inquilinus limosus TaxID=171674 RepID=UPI003F14381C